MGSVKVVFSGAVGLFAIVLLIVGLKATAQNKIEKRVRADNAQAPADSGLVRLSAPAKASPEASKSSSSVGFESAALRNAQLQGGLGWAFGGKQQKGWYLYTPLIAHLIGAGVDAGTAGFAMQLSVWQRENGIEPTGALDNDTWSRMVSAFQSRRVNGSSNSSPGNLVPIPVSDCYDPDRPEELRKADSLTFAAYKRMVAAASVELKASGDAEVSSNDKFFKVVSAFRSREYQDHLRKQSPNSGRAGLAVNSPHSTGRALDLYVGGEPVSTKDENRAIQTQTAAYRWLVKNAARFGFQPYFYEPWHWEYVGVSTDVERQGSVDRAK
jgi:hypothetical protein